MKPPTRPVIRVRNAREHNLRGVDLDVPRHAMTVFTGVSGSGKSSLAFDTLYAEGQRRFVESLSAYARQFIGQVERPKVDLVDGLSPTLCIDQKTVNRNPRSTVGTVTEIWDHLRLLYARLGTPHCPHCGTEVARVGVDRVVDDLLAWAKGERLVVLGPVVRERKGEYRKELDELRRDGWVRARVDGEIKGLDEEIVLARYEKHTIEIVVDRLVPDEADRPRLDQAVETAARVGKGVVVALKGTEERTFSTERACPNHPEASIPELEPRLFSFNAPQGACPTCSGLGALEGFDVARIVDRTLKLPDACLAFNDDGRIPFTWFDADTLLRVAKQLGAPVGKPLAEWPEDKLHGLLHGVPELIYESRMERDGRVDVRQRPWSGIVGLLEMVWEWTKFPPLEKHRSRTDCPGCAGRRLNPAALAVTFRGLAIDALSGRSVAGLFAWADGLELTPSEREIGAQIVAEIRERLGFLHDVGLDYLTLDRGAATLSGGEAQRIRLAAQVGSALQGVTYILDEPSIGLHPRDNRRLLTALARLRDRGNTLVVVEHDAETVLAADWVVDVGPGPGKLGGEIVSVGTPEAVIAGPGLTAKYLRGELAIPTPKKRRKGNGKFLEVRGARANNLKDVSAKIPLGALTVFTGVSGSGKSSLLFEVIEPSARAKLAGRGPVLCDAISLADLDAVVTIDQSPIGRTPRSNPATYTGAMDTIRDLFASTEEARARGWKKGRFSFNVPGGRCDACEGAGVRTVEMQFLPSVEVPCESCGGRRFNAETLEVRYKGLTITEVLDLPIADAATVFAAVPKLARILDTLVSVGLGYIALGQPSTTLSGGEAQRMKLASELHRPEHGKTLYLLDEPTTGLHFDDVAKLLAAVSRLVDHGNTVIVVEHNHDVVKCADVLIDLGPEGGEAGGRILGVGTPEKLAKSDTPTGRALAASPDFGGPAWVAEARPPAWTVAGPKAIEVRGARQHNLQGVDVSIPHGTLTVVTGPSGSGKTSLAFDTIFSEGQRRYVESLSTYARRFLGRMERAHVERVEGLAPAIAIDQNASGHNPRSTVGTVTEIQDVLRLLWARIGQPHCPTCDRALVARPPSDAAAWLKREGIGAGWVYAWPASKSPAAARKRAWIAEGWTKLLDVSAKGAKEVELDDKAAEAAIGDGAALVIDRVDPAKNAAQRVAEAIEKAQGLADGVAWFRERKTGRTELLARRATCPEHGSILPDELTPRHFSFNSRLGACVTCEGTGRTRQIVPELLIPRPEKGLADAIDPRAWAGLQRSARHAAVLDELVAHLGLKPETPVAKWSAEQRKVLFFGLPAPFTVKWKRQYGRTVRVVEEEREWAGLIPLFTAYAGRFEHLFAEAACPACRGARLRPELLSVRIGGDGPHDFARKTVDEALAAVDAWGLVGEAAVIAERPLVELRKRLRFLIDVGLGYLGLDRPADTLSGGESQRIRLASQLGTGLTGVIYVLDEPTIGLHPRDTARLITTLEGLRDLGNTVLVVEHDPDTIRRADHVIDLGPGAGRYGGKIVAQGSPKQIAKQKGSVTGPWLSGQKAMPARAKPRKPRSWMTLVDPRAHNLQTGDVRFPTGVWVGVSGVSGSGKSTLVMDTLATLLQASTELAPEATKERPLVLGERVDKVVIVDQAPIGRNPRSTPATYCGILDALRQLYAQTPGARERGWEAGRFSFNTSGGRCETCEGRGATLVEMHFLPDVWVTCDACKGRRFRKETLEVRFGGASIADALAMRADEALEIFARQRAIARGIQGLVDVGLGYLALGQPGNTLSGGEAQRVKLAAELVQRKGHVVYVLDEPTTGLHLDDVAALVGVLHRLVDAGHTVITIEHHLDMLRQADWIVDLGPEAGAGGGRIVGQGTPKEIAKLGTPTGVALRG